MQLHTVTDMLLSKVYVRVITLDTVSHATVFQRKPVIDVPDEIYNWMRNCYESHTHCTNFSGKTSKFLEILIF